MYVQKQIPKRLTSLIQFQIVRIVLVLCFFFLFHLTIWNSNVFAIFVLFCFHNGIIWDFFVCNIFSSLFTAFIQIVEFSIFVVLSICFASKIRGCMIFPFYFEPWFQCIEAYFACCCQYAFFLIRIKHSLYINIKYILLLQTALLLWYIII